MSTNEQIPTGESGELEFEWTGSDPISTPHEILPLRPPIDTPISRALIRAAIRELTSPTWKLGQPDLLVVGVSGGVDSIVLLHLLIHLQNQKVFEIPLWVAHYDHQLREDSHLDAEFVEKVAERWGVPVTINRDPIRRSNGNLESEARYSRYLALFTAGRPKGVLNFRTTVAVAHHANDQAETVLMHAARGTGLEGLAAMRGISRSPTMVALDQRVVRPLLRASRSEIEQYARENSLPWREDATNRDVRITRNFVRHEVIPKLEMLNPEVAKAFERLSRISAYESDRLKRLTANQVDRLLIETTIFTRFLFGVNEFLELEIEDQIACLRLQVTRQFHELGEPGIDELEELAIALRDHLAQRPSATTGPHPWGIGLAWSAFERPPIFGKTSRVLSIHKASEPAWMPIGPWIEEVDLHLLRRSFQLPWTIGLQGEWRLRVRKREVARLRQKQPPKGAIWLDAEKVRAVQLGVFESGMRIAPLGMGGKRKSVGNLFTDKKIPEALRPKWPLLINAETDEILWVSWLAQSEACKVTTQTKWVWECAWRTEYVGTAWNRNLDQFRDEEDE